MRPDEVRRAEVPADASCPSALKSAPPRESFSVVMGAPGAPPSPDPASPPIVVAPMAGSYLAGGPSSLLGPAGLGVLAAHAPGLCGSSSTRTGRPDPLDPATRHSAQIAPLLGITEAPTASASKDAPVQATARASLEEVLPALVRRIAWSGDGRRGTIRLEFGQGALAGGTLLVHSDDGRVRVELQAPSGTDTAAWRTRIASRLTKRGLQLDELVVE